MFRGCGWWLRAAGERVLLPRGRGCEGLGEEPSGAKGQSEDGGGEALGARYQMLGVAGRGLCLALVRDQFFGRVWGEGRSARARA